MRGELAPLTSFQQLQSLSHWEPWSLMSHGLAGGRAGGDSEAPGDPSELALSSACGSGGCGGAVGRGGLRSKADDQLPGLSKAWSPVLFN